MQNLHQDPAALSMHCLWDDLVMFGVMSHRHAGATPCNHPGHVGGDAPRHHQACFPCCPLRIKRSEFLHPVPFLFKTGVHASHQDSIGKDHAAQIQRFEHMGIQLVLAHVNQGKDDSLPILIRQTPGNLW